MCFSILTFLYSALCQTSVWYLCPLVLASFLFFLFPERPWFCVSLVEKCLSFGTVGSSQSPFLFLIFFISLRKLSLLVPAFLVSLANYSHDSLCCKVMFGCYFLYCKYRSAYGYIQARLNLPFADHFKDKIRFTITTIFQHFFRLKWLKRHYLKCIHAGNFPAKISHKMTLYSITGFWSTVSWSNKTIYV